MQVIDVQEEGTTGELYRRKDAWASNTWTEQSVVSDAPPVYWKHAEVLYYTSCFCFILPQPKTEAIFRLCQLFYLLIHQSLSLYISAWYRLGCSYSCPTSSAHGADESHWGEHMPHITRPVDASKYIHSWFMSCKTISLLSSCNGQMGQFTFPLAQEGLATCPLPAAGNSCSLGNEEGEI